MPIRHDSLAILAGIGISLLLHGVVLTGLNLDLPTLPTLPDPPPIEARLVKVAKPAAVEASTPRAIRRPGPPVERALVPPPPVVEQVPDTPDAAAPEQPPVVDPAMLSQEEPSPPAPPAAHEPPAGPPVEAVEAIPLNPLPGRIDLLYELSYGPASGEQTVRWVGNGERYTITSVAAATGLTSLFYSGRLMQVSQGRITPAGLQPEEFWDQRGGKKHSVGRFDSVHRTVTVSRGKRVKTTPLPERVQDTQSLPFHFALTAPHFGSGSFAVFNGKNLRTFHFALIGEETLKTALGELRTLHIERAKAPADGRFEVWLAADLHYLPVRMRYVDDSDGAGELAGELVIRSITYPQ